MQLKNMSRQDCIRLIHESAEQLKLTDLSTEQKQLVDMIDCLAFKAYTSPVEDLGDIQDEKIIELPVIGYPTFGKLCGRYAGW